MRKGTIQGEFLSVLYSKDMPESEKYLSPFGPGDNPIANSSTITISGAQGNLTNGLPSNCYINLASIGNDAGDSGPIDAALTGSDYWRSRWVPVGHSDQIKLDSVKSLLELTVNELSSQTDLYDNGNYRIPAIPSIYQGDETLGQILSSNSAFLPPLSGLSAETASKICEQYKIKVGYGDDVGNFYSSDQPVSKRLPRRVESISMSAWPEDLMDNTVYDVYDAEYTQINVVDLEKGFNLGGVAEVDTLQTTTGGGCRTSSTSPTVTNTSFEIGDKLTAAYGASNSIRTLVGGSSIALDEDLNSERCVSMYGIQDLVGNLMTVPVEELVCDYSDREIIYSKGSFTLPFTGVTMTPVISADVEILRETTLAIVEPSGAANSMSSNMGDFDSGYCSVAHNDKLHVDVRTPNSDVFLSLFKPNGDTYAPLLDRPLQSTFYDIIALDFLRNGDGNYLNFGAEHIGKSLFKKNSFVLDQSLQFGNMLDNLEMFNPIIGLPVNPMVTDYFDTYSRSVISPDNYHNNMFIGNGSYSNPLGLSDWRRVGIGGSAIAGKSTTDTDEITMNAFGGDSYVFDGANPQLVPSYINIITQYIVDVGGNVVSTVQESLYDHLDVNSDGTPDAGTVEFYRASFAVTKDSRFSINSQGSFAKQGGRYGASIELKKKASVDYGTRCIAKINED